MNYNRRRNSSFSRKLKDYIVPIIGIFLVFILFIYLFTGNSKTPTPNKNMENSSGILLSLDSDISKANIIYPGDTKSEMEGDINLYKGEKVIVKEGSLTGKLDGQFDFKLNKVGELKYNENGDLDLSSGEMWLNNEENANINMTFAKVKSEKGSHLSFSQNEMGSTVYLVSGLAEVANLAGKSTALASGEKITISRGDASNKDKDLSLSKENLDQFFIKSDWYILNKGSSFGILEGGVVEGETGTGSNSGSGKISSNNKNSILEFSNLIDGANVSDSKININGNYLDSNVFEITLNGKKAILDKGAQTFKIENVDTSKQENDLVFKVLDEGKDILSRFVYTVYYNDGSSSNTEIKKDNSSTNSQKVHSFDVDGSKFVFTSPTTNNTFTTTDTFVTIRGKVLASGVDSIKINDYKLNSFNGSTWRYHADFLNNNFTEGTNIYEIKYYSGENLLYTNYFTIIKKPASQTQKSENNDNLNSQSGAIN